MHLLGVTGIDINAFDLTVKSCGSVFGATCLNHYCLEVKENK